MPSLHYEVLDSDYHLPGLPLPAGDIREMREDNLESVCLAFDIAAVVQLARIIRVQIDSFICGF
jgi:hypothetical protein